MTQPEAKPANFQEENGQIVQGFHMLTQSGKLIDLREPNPELITLDDIAHHLAFTYRWAGALPISVGQHVLMGVYQIEDYYKPQWLLHDAEEAYFCDFIKPIKKHMIRENWQVIMKDWRIAIYKKFGVAYESLKDEPVAWLDQTLLEFEYDLFVRGTVKQWVLDPYKVKEKLIKQFNLWLKTGGDHV